MQRRRRAATAVAVLIMLVVLIGFASLAVDVGRLYAVKGELQRASDSAARAGTSAFADDSLRGSSSGPNGNYMDAMKIAAASRAILYASRNKVEICPTLLGDADVVVGWYDFTNPGGPLGLGGNANAVQVTGRFTQDSPNGAVSNYFAQILGFAATDVSATATAAFDDRFSSYTPAEPGVLIPFTMYVNEYEQQAVTGPDNFSYDQDLDTVIAFGDGIREIRLFPYADDGGGDGAGNFGLLNVGTANQSVPGLNGQIQAGITPEDLELEIGTSTISFYDDDGSPTTHQITGSPGVKGGTEPAIEARVGDVVGFFVHSSVSDGGSNASYTIVGIRFGRVMEVVLSGNPDQRRITVQPVIYSGPGVYTAPGAPSSNGMVGQIVLVR